MSLGRILKLGDRCAPEVVILLSTEDHGNLVELEGINLQKNEVLDCQAILRLKALRIYHSFLSHPRHKYLHHKLNLGELIS